jgi:hypothetical protein
VWKKRTKSAAIEWWQWLRGRALFSYSLGRLCWKRGRLLQGDRLQGNLCRDQFCHADLFSRCKLSLLHAVSLMYNWFNYEMKDLLMCKGLVTRAISSAISCPICCKSHMQFGVSAIWCRTRNCYRLHVACDMVLRFAVRTDTDTESHTKSQIH